SRHAGAGSAVGSRWPIIAARNALRPDHLRQVAERPEPTPAERRHYRLQGCNGPFCREFLPYTEQGPRRGRFCVGTKSCALRSDTPTRATPRAHKEPAGSLPSRLMSDSQGRNGSMRHGVPRSIEASNTIHACMALRWNETQNEDSFAHQDGRRPRKGPLFGGSPLTIETGSDFPIGITASGSAGSRTTSSRRSAGSRSG